MGEGFAGRSQRLAPEKVREMMADIIDDANAAAEVHLDAALRNYKQSPIIAHATGECLHCGKDLPPERRWCDAICRDAWQEEHKA